MKKILVLGACLALGTLSARGVSVSYYIYQNPSTANYFGYQHSGSSGPETLLNQWVSDHYGGSPAPEIEVGYEYDRFYHFNNVKIGSTTPETPNLQVLWSGDATMLLVSSLIRFEEDSSKDGYYRMGVQIDPASRYLRLTMYWADEGPWVVVDDVTFTEVAPIQARFSPVQDVPETAATAALLGFSILGLGCLGKLRRATHAA